MPQHVTFKPSLYLSGSIEQNKKHGVWRQKVYKALHRKYKIIIPEKSECPFDKNEPEFKEWVYERTVKKDMVDLFTAKYIFVKVDPQVFGGAGTISEITMAAQFGKDIVYMLDGIKEEDIPLWTLGCLAGATEVESIEEAIEYYREKAKERKKEAQEAQEAIEEK